MLPFLSLILFCAGQREWKDISDLWLFSVVEERENFENERSNCSTASSELQRTKETLKVLQVCFTGIL